MVDGHCWRRLQPASTPRGDLPPPEPGQVCPATRGERGRVRYAALAGRLASLSRPAVLRSPPARGGRALLAQVAACVHPARRFATPRAGAGLPRHARRKGARALCGACRALSFAEPPGGSSFTTRPWWTGIVGAGCSPRPPREAMCSAQSRGRSAPPRARKRNRRDGALAPSLRSIICAVAIKTARPLFAARGAADLPQLRARFSYAEQEHTQSSGLIIPALQRSSVVNNQE